MRKMLASAVALTALVALAGFSPTASAAAGGCVTKREFRIAHRGMTPKQIRHLFDTGGREVYRARAGEYVETETERVVEDPDNTVNQYDMPWQPGQDPYHYEGNTLVPGMAMKTEVDIRSEWVDLGIDTIRTYRKCRSFDDGFGRVGINFDDYSGWDDRLRTYSKRRYAADYFYGDRVAK